MKNRISNSETLNNEIEDNEISKSETLNNEIEDKEIAKSEIESLIAQNEIAESQTVKTAKSDKTKLIIAILSILLISSIILGLNQYKKLNSIQSDLGKINSNIAILEKDLIEKNQQAEDLQDQIVEKEEAISTAEQLVAEQLEAEQLAKESKYEVYAGIEKNDDNTYTASDEAIAALLLTENYSDLSETEMKKVLIEGGLAEFIVGLQVYENYTLEEAMNFIFSDQAMSEVFKEVLVVTSTQTPTASATPSTSGGVTSPEVVNPGETSFMTNDLTNTGGSIYDPNFNLH